MSISTILVNFFGTVPTVCFFGFNFFFISMREVFFQQLIRFAKWQTYKYTNSHKKWIKNTRICLLLFLWMKVGLIDWNLHQPLIKSWCLLDTCQLFHMILNWTLQCLINCVEIAYGSIHIIKILCTTIKIYLHKKSFFMKCLLKLFGFSFHFFTSRYLMKVIPETRRAH